MPDAAAVVTEAAPTDHTRPPSPYVGLSFYSAEDADFFFGRETERQVVMSNLRAARLTLLHADSGVGKSSLLRAGVAARLDQIARNKFYLGDSIDVPVVFSSWKDDPISELIGEIERTINSYLPTWDAVALSRESLTEAIAAGIAALDGGTALNHAVTSSRETVDLQDRPSSTLLIILDQFEEYFLYGSPDVRERLADDLSAAINKPDLSANFLISIREESFAALGNLLRGRMRNVYGNDLHLGYLDSKRAREAIERPVERFNHLHPDRWVEIEDGLAEALLLEVRRVQNGDGQAGEGLDPADLELPEANGRAPADSNGRDGEVITPYLQLVMTKLWEHDQGSGLLQLRTLEELHGARQIVADHLNEALSGLHPEQRDTAIESLHHLVTPSGTKIALEVGDLAAYTRRPVDQVAAVLEALAGDARILRTVPPAPGKSPDDPANQRYEIYHDVLAHPINQAVNARALGHERRRAVRFRRIAAGALALALLALGAAIIAVFALRDASTQEHVAQSGQLAAAAEGQLSSNPELATQLALSAWQVHHTPLAEKALRDALPQLQLQRILQAQSPLTSVAFNRDGSRIAVANSDGIASLWNTDTDKQVGAFGLPGLSALESVAFSPDGSKLVTAYSDGTARIWNVKSQQQIGAPLTQHGDLKSAAFSPDGKKIVTAGSSGVARVWDVRSHHLLHELRTGDGAPFSDAAFSPDGKLIAASSNARELEVWSASTYRPLAHQNDTRTPLYSVAFSPDGRKLVTATGSGEVFIWSATRLGQPLGTLSGKDVNTINVMTNAMWSGTGKLIVAAGLDGQARVWNASARASQPARMLRAGNVSMRGIAVDAKGDRVVTAGADGVARIWDPRTGKQLAVLRTAGLDTVIAAAFSPDNRVVGNATYDGNVNMWNATTGKLLFHYTLPHRAGANDIRIRKIFGRDTAIVAGKDGFVYVIDAATGELMRELVAGGATNITAADYSPQSREWVTAGQESSQWVIRLWRFRGSSWRTGSLTEVGTGMIEPDQVTYVYDVEFSADGKRVVAASGDYLDYDGSARVWSSSGSDSNAVATFIEPDGPAAQKAIRSAVFSRNGERVLTASDDGTARIWDMAAPRYPLPGTIADPQGDPLRWAAFSPDSRWVATASQDAGVRVWDSASQRELLTLAGHSGAVNTVSFNSGGTQLVTASTDGTTRLWDALPVEGQGDPIDEEHQADVNTVAFSPNGRVIASADSDGYARLWNATTDQHQMVAALREPKGAPVSSAEFSSDGRWLVTGDAEGNAVLWDAATHHQLASFDDQNGIYALAGAEISPDRTMIVTAGATYPGGPHDGDGAAIWRVRLTANGKQVHVTPPQHLAAGSSVRWAVFSPDSRLIVTADNSGVARVWDAATGEQVGATLTEPGGEAVSDAWFSPSLAGSAPGWLRHMVQGSTLRLGSHEEPWLIVTGSDDGTARVWNLRTGAQVAVFTAPDRSAIYNAMFSPNGQFVLTASQDGTARIWSLRTGAQITQFNAGDPIPIAEFSPGGDRVVVGTDFGTVRVFWTRLEEPMQQLVALAHSRLTTNLTADERRRYLSGG
jgi:WD40 repeat protein